MARHLTIPLNGSTVAALLWTLAVVLMAWDILGGNDHLGRLSILVAMVALCLTMNALLRHHRRVVLEVISHHFRMAVEDDLDRLPPQREGPARPLRSRQD